MAVADRRRRGEVLSGVLQVLAAAPGGLSVSEVIARTAELVPPTQEERTEYRPGANRYRQRLRFHTINAVKAGWLLKERGKPWRITDAGRAALDRYTDPEELARAADEAYRAWRNEKSKVEAAADDFARLTLLRDAVDGLGLDQWTTYHDLAQLLGTTETDVKRLLREHQDIENQHHVLPTDLHTAYAPDHPHPSGAPDRRPLLEADGIVFDAEGHPDPTQYVTADMFRDLLDVPGPGRRAWLVKSRVKTVSLMQDWLDRGYSSLAAEHLRTLPADASRAEVAAAVEEGYADRSYIWRQRLTSEFADFLSRM